MKRKSNTMISKIRTGAICAILVGVPAIGRAEPLSVDDPTGIIK